MGEILTFKPNETTGNGEVRDNRDIISHEEDYSNLRHGGEIMENKYITEKGLSNLEEKTDLKIKNSETKLEGQFNLVVEKLDRISEKTENTDKKINWVITGVILAILIPVFTQLMLKLIGI